jgi:hypothetical protein
MESIEKINGLLELFSEAPDSQLDKKMTKYIKSLIGKQVPEIKKGIMYVIDMCVFSSYASGSTLRLLHILFENYLDGKQEEFNEENCPWRKDYNCIAP